MGHFLAFVFKRVGGTIYSCKGGYQLQKTFLCADLFEAGAATHGNSVTEARTLSGSLGGRVSSEASLLPA